MEVIRLTEERQRAWKHFMEEDIGSSNSPEVSVQELQPIAHEAALAVHVREQQAGTRIDAIVSAGFYPEGRAAMLAEILAEELGRLQGNLLTVGTVVHDAKARRLRVYRHGQSLSGSDIKVLVVRRRMLFVASVLRRSHLVTHVMRTATNPENQGGDALTTEMRSRLVAGIVAPVVRDRAPLIAGYQELYAGFTVPVYTYAQCDLPDWGHSTGLSGEHLRFSEVVPAEV